MAHDPEIWRKALYWFRVWSAKNAIRHRFGEGLSLIAINEDEPSQSRPQGKPIAFLPCYHTNACTAYEIYADVRGSREAFNWFMGLAQWSGSHLSIQFLEQTPIDPRTSPDNLWLGLMFHVNWAAAVEARRQRMSKWIWRDGELAPAGGFNRGGFDRDPLVVSYPFQDGARTIEWCRLDTDQPAFLPMEIPDPEAAPPSGSVPAARPGELRKPRMSREKADAKGRRLEATHPDPENVSQRDWAQMIGCSHGLVPYLSFYQELHPELAPPSDQRLSNVVPYVEGQTEFAASTPDNDWQAEIDAKLDRDEELRRLISQQAADAEPSPLESFSKPVRVRQRP